MVVENLIDKIEDDHGPFYERMLRGAYKDDLEEEEDNSERRQKFQNKMLARVGRSKSKFFRLA